MKKTLRNLVTIFFIEVQGTPDRNELKRFSKRSFKPAWTDKQLHVISEIKTMYEKDYLKGSLDNQASHSDIQIWAATNKRLQRLCDYYIAAQRRGESDLEKIKTEDADYREWVSAQPYEVGEEAFHGLLEEEDVCEHIRLVSKKIEKLQEFSRTLGISFNDFTHPDRDKVLHCQFGLD